MRSHDLLVRVRFLFTLLCSNCEVTLPWVFGWSWTCETVKVSVEISPALQFPLLRRPQEVLPKDSIILDTLPNTNMSPKKGPFQKERIVFQPLFFKGHSLVFRGVPVQYLRHLLWVEVSRKSYLHGFATCLAVGPQVWTICGGQRDWLLHQCLAEKIRCFASPLPISSIKCVFFSRSCAK